MYVMGRYSNSMTAILPSRSLMILAITVHANYILYISLTNERSLKRVDTNICLMHFKEKEIFRESEFSLGYYTVRKVHVFMYVH